MNRLNSRLGDRGLLILLLILLGGIVIVERVIATRTEQRTPLSSQSNEANGASAMASWLERLGFDLDDTLLTRFEVPQETGLIFLLEPTEVINDEEWSILFDWVEQEHGILVVSGSGWTADRIYNRLGYDLFSVESTETADLDIQLQAESPFFSAADLDGQLVIDASLNRLPLTPTENQVVHVSANGSPFVVSHPIGNGQIILIPETSIFTNRGLAGETNRKLLISLVAQVGSGRKIWFDEWHHGDRALDFSAGEITGPLDWIRFTPSGRSVLLVCAILFLFVLFNGRHLGRPQPLAESSVRRGPAEYVDAMATLTRKSGETQVVAQHTYQRFRRILIKRYRLDPNMADSDLIEAIKQIKSAAMGEETADILRQLTNSSHTDTNLIHLHTQIDQFMEEYL